VWNDWRENPQLRLYPKALFTRTTKRTPQK
jgi:hypothetical protein